MLWILFAALVVAAGLRYRHRLHAARRAGAAPRVDDDAVRQILERGRLRADRPGGRADMRAAAEAEEEFWSETWDEPEEYRP